MFWFIQIIAYAALSGGLAGAAVGFLVSLCCDTDLDKATLAEQVRANVTKIKCGPIFKIMIEKRKQHAVDVGIFKKNEVTPYGTVEISTTKGVSDKLYEGQVIYL